MGNNNGFLLGSNASTAIGFAGLLVSLFECCRHLWNRAPGAKKNERPDMDPLQQGGQTDQVLGTIPEEWVETDSMADTTVPDNTMASNRTDPTNAAATAQNTQAIGHQPRGNTADKPNRCWCFTWNNPPMDYEDKIKAIFDDPMMGLQFIIYGRETGLSQTFHLQGFLQTQESMPVAAISGGGPAQKFFQAHWTKARRVKASIEYCKKDGHFTELGEYQGRQAAQGTRNDIGEFKEAVKAAQELGEPMTSAMAREAFSDIYAKYPRFCDAYIADLRPTPEIRAHDMYPWQRALEDRLLNHEPCDREIMFVVDLPGNSGKSWFSKQFLARNPSTQLMSPGKLADMAFALDEATNVLLIDCPRSRYELFQYDFIEYVKNGLVFSTKYESRTKRLGKCHVVVFMNQLPDDTKLSKDRYTIIEITRALLRMDDPDTLDITTWQALQDYQSNLRLSRDPRMHGMGAGFFPGSQLQHH